MLNVAVLVSGGGTNLQAILDAKAAGALPHAKIALVLASKPGVYALERASKAGVPGIVVARKSYAAPEEYDAALLAALREHRIDVVVLAGFLSILGPSVIAAYPERILNVHPSLIPSFCGAGYYGLRVHEAALAKGVKVTGATVHFVNEVPDGGRILLQQPVDVLPGDTPETLQKRVMEQAEWKLLPRALAQLTEELDAADGPAAPRKEEKDMDPLSLAAELAVNTYPGRGIVLGGRQKRRHRLFHHGPQRKQPQPRVHREGRRHHYRSGGPLQAGGPVPHHLRARARAGQNNHRDQRRPDGYDIRPPDRGQGLCQGAAHAHL